MLFSQRQVEFAKLYSSKLFILDGLRRLANNPRALYGRSKTLFFDDRHRSAKQVKVQRKLEQYENADLTYFILNGREKRGGSPTLECWGWLHLQCLDRR